MAAFNGHFDGEIPPFEEAVSWFLNKGIVSPEEFAELSRSARLRAFSAAQVYGADELLAIYNALLHAIETGTDYAEFARATEDILLRPWHRETVFRTNVLSAYGRGHWRQAQETAAARPYARYSAVMDGRTRPSHAALHGLVYPLDHPFWRLYWPPWDYNCRCAAMTLSAEEVREGGFTVRMDLGSDLPPPSPKFASPAADTPWSPDYGKYPPELAARLREKVEALYD